MTRTAMQIVADANKLAGMFYEAMGYVHPNDAFRFDLSTHPQERMCWDMAVIAYEELTDTSPEDALSDLED